MDHLALLHCTKGGDADRRRSGRMYRIATQEWAVVCMGIIAKSRSEAAHPALAEAAWQRECQEKPEWPRAFCRQVRKVDAQRLPPHRVGRIIRKEVHTRDESIASNHQIATRGRGEGGGIIFQIKSPWVVRQWPEMAGDEFILAGTGRLLGHGPQRRAAANSPARHRRAMWSSTALTSPVSSLSTNACAMSTYSDTITRAGTSLRCSSS